MTLYIYDPFFLFALVEWGFSNADRMGQLRGHGNENIYLAFRSVLQNSENRPREKFGQKEEEENTRPPLASNTARNIMHGV